MSTSTSTETQQHPEETYTPGYLFAKIGMLIFCGLITLFSVMDMAPKLYLLFYGNTVRAEVSGVQKKTADGEVILIRNDADARAAVDDEDRVSVYHNEFSFRLPDGTTQRSLSPIGRITGPHFTILDEEGLPNTVIISYLRSEPSVIVLPAEYGTWFFPGTIFLFGISGTIVSVMFILTARKPITVPHFHSPPGADNLAETLEEEEDNQKKDEAK